MNFGEMPFNPVHHPQPPNSVAQRTAQKETPDLKHLLKYMMGSLCCTVTASALCLICGSTLFWWHIVPYEADALKIQQWEEVHLKRKADLWQWLWGTWERELGLLPESGPASHPASVRDLHRPLPARNWVMTNGFPGQGVGWVFWTIDVAWKSS